MNNHPVVLITGALTGIGRATALAFAQEGSRVVISGRRDDAGQALVTELRALGAEAEFVRADVRREGEVRNLVDKTVERFGRLDVRKLQIVGAAPGAYRRIGVVPGGSFEGERLSGEVLDGGNDWQTVRTDGATTLNARLVLKTKDEALIGMTYRGIRYGPPDVVARIEKGEVVDPTSYYFRINPLFETANANYDWLNRVVAIGIGHRRADGPIYSVFEVL